METLPESWKQFLNGYTDFSELEKTLRLVESGRERCEVFPPAGSVFRAFELTPPESVRSVILGQDPYHEPGQAQGLAFSVPDGVPLPPSLRNIFREYAEDTGFSVPRSGDLSRWAESGVLLLNSVLTVECGSAASHAKKMGWERFTDSVIRALSSGKEGISFLLWGNFAAGKRELIDASKHQILVSAHPSPLSARRGFFGSRPFSKSAAYNGIDWRLSE